MLVSCVIAVDYNDGKNGWLAKGLSKSIVGIIGSGSIARIMVDFLKPYMCLSRGYGEIFNFYSGCQGKCCFLRERPKLSRCRFRG